MVSRQGGEMYCILFCAGLLDAGVAGGGPGGGGGGAVLLAALLQLPQPRGAGRLPRHLHQAGDAAGRGGGRARGGGALQHRLVQVPIQIK